MADEPPAEGVVAMGRPYTVLFSDLDGTLLDHHTYAAGAAERVVARLGEEDIPLVLCSSKTRAEIEEVRRQLKVRHPFISENGGAVFVPPMYFPFRPPGARERDGFDVVAFGRPHEEVVASLRRIGARLGIAIVGFHEMTDEEASADCGFPLAEARLARQREYDEPFRVLDPAPDRAPRLCRALEAEGLRCTRGGRFWHVASRGVDKGAAVSALTALYRRAHDSVVTVGLGDGLNDIPLLLAVDRPIIVRNRAAGALDELARAVPSARVTDGEGPAGWADAVLAVLDDRNPLT